MNKPPLVSLIIPSYNGRDMSINLLNSLKRLTYKNYEIVLVDNGSSDGTYEYVKKNYPYVKLVRTEKNKGFAGGMNLGIRQSHGKYFVVMNNDMIVYPNWLTELVKIALFDENFGIIGYVLISPDKKVKRLGQTETNNLILNFNPVNLSKKNQSKNWIEIDSTFGLTRRDISQKIELFDEKYFIYWEEIDLCYRMRKAGYKVVASTKAKVFHPGDSTMKSYSYLKAFHWHKNRIRFILKNLSLPRKLVNVPSTLIYFIFKMIYNLVKLDWKTSYAIFSGIIWNIKNYHDYIK